MAVIEFDSVSKSYLLGSNRTNLREALAHAARKVFNPQRSETDDQLFWALRDVSFKVEPGEVLGIIGHNGAGKSTTLKLLSRVTFPTSGQIHSRGRMAALIELGAGFHPDLSGRENIYLNGSILGLKRREIDEQFSQIVEFAELERFIDTPVKRYSSGMYVRLAFAVAAHVKADLLLVDEVLSVGDMNFQSKCLNKMQELRDAGATIIFISHNLWSVSMFCKRALLLSAGQIVAEGHPDDVIDTYRHQAREALVSRTGGSHSSANGSGALDSSVVVEHDTPTITRIELLNEAGQAINALDPQDRLVVRCHYVAPRPIATPLFTVRIRRTDGLICTALCSPEDDVHPIHEHGMFEVCIGPLRLVPNIYNVEALIIDQYQPIVYATSIEEVFRVNGILADDHEGIFEPEAEWDILHKAVR